jgi:hypothetical protein
MGNTDIPQVPGEVPAEFTPMVGPDLFEGVGEYPAELIQERTGALGGILVVDTQDPKPRGFFYRSELVILARPGNPPWHELYVHLHPLPDVPRKRFQLRRTTRPLLGPLTQPMLAKDLEQRGRRHVDLLILLEKTAEPWRPVPALSANLAHQGDHHRRDLEVNHGGPTAAIPQHCDPLSLEALPPLIEGGAGGTEIAAGRGDILVDLVVRKNAGSLLDLLFRRQQCGPGASNRLLLKPGSGVRRCSAGVLSATRTRACCAS